MTDDLHERVEPDDELSGDEKETTISMYGTDEAMTVYSEKATVVRDLLRHDNLEVLMITGLDDETYVRVDDREAARERLDVIHGVKGEMPVGCLTVKSKPRSNDYQSSIVSHETVSSEAWGDD